MEIKIAKHNGKGQTAGNEYYSVLNYKTITPTTSLLLVSLGKMGLEDNSDVDFYEIFKVQFIASCQTDFRKEPLLVAFYLGEGNELTPYGLDSLMGDYYFGGQNLMLIDYKSYCEICDYTKETKLSLADYIKEVNVGSIGVNSLLNGGEKLLNYDEQKIFFEELDKLKMN
jgi:hypothetical protein